MKNANCEHHYRYTDDVFAFDFPSFNSTIVPFLTLSFPHSLSPGLLFNVHSPFTYMFGIPSLENVTHTELIYFLRRIIVFFFSLLPSLCHAFFCNIIPLYFLRS